MASNYHKSPCKNLGYSSASYETEDYASSRNASSEYVDLRCEEKYRPKHLNFKTSRKTRTGIRTPNFGFYDTELLEEYSDRSEKLDSTHWPALKSSANNRKSDKKLQNQSKGNDVSVQADSNDPEQNAYPLWSTKEIVYPSKDDTPVYKQNRVSRSTQVDDAMLMKHEEEPQICKKPNKVLKSAFKVTKNQQNHKTYADVVQQEGENYGQQFNNSSAEIKTFFKVKGVKRKQISPVSKDSTEGSSTNSSIKDSDDEKGSPSFNFTGFAESLSKKFLTRTSDTTDNDIPYREYGDGDSITKGSKKLLYVESEGDTAEYKKSHNNAHHQIGEFKEDKQNLVDDSYYSCEQVVMRKMAEKIAIEGLDFETANKVRHQLWSKKKSRLPYTQMFTRTSLNNSRVINQVLSIPDLNNRVTSELNRGQGLGSSAELNQHFGMYSEEAVINNQTFLSYRAFGIEEMHYNNFMCSYLQVFEQRP